MARSILVIIFHLLADPEARFHDLGPGYYDTHIDRQRKIRNHIRQLEALGLDVSPAPRTRRRLTHRRRPRAHRP